MLARLMQFLRLRVAFEHLNTQVAERNCPGDRAAGAAGDKPGQGAAPLAGAQPPRPTVDQGDSVCATVFGAIVVDPCDQVVEVIV